MKISPMFKSKRFVAFTMCLGIFTAIYITSLFTSIVVDAIALGTALFMLSGIYIVGQSVRGSKKPDEVG